MFRLFAKLLAALRGGPAPLIGTLADERKGQFFTWFHLAPRQASSPGDDGRTWHHFHPEGSNFQHLVKLDVLTTPSDEIVAARLSLDREFVEDRRNSPFARDIAKSFLAWSLRHEPGRATAQPLIGNIATFGAFGATVLTRGDAPQPPVDTTGGYAVYLGRREEATLSLTRIRLTLRNVALTNGSSGHRWLTVDVAAQG
jgi:hypothetical protein